METKRLEYNLKNFDYFRKNINITFLLKKIRELLLILTVVITASIIIGIFILIFDSNFRKLLLNKNFTMVYCSWILLIIILIFLVLNVFFTITVKRKTEKIYSQVYELYLENANVYKKRIIYRNAHRALCILAVNLEQQKLIERHFLGILLKNEKVNKLLNRALFFRDDRVGSKKMEKLKNKVLYYEDSLQNYDFSFKQLDNIDEENVYSYYIKINDFYIWLNDDKEIFSESIFSQGKEKM